MTNFLSTLRALDAAATPGPWTVDQDKYSCYWHVGVNGKSYTRECAFCDGSAGGEYSPNCTHETRDLLIFLRNHAAAIAGVVEAAKAFVDSETPDEGACDNPDCAICPSLFRLRSALAALEDK